MPAPSLEQWRIVFDMALRARDVAPWGWMDEADLFAVRNPERDETGYVSVCGRTGEHFGVSVYLGAAGFNGFRALRNHDLARDPEPFFETPQLHASFEDRREIQAKDLGLVRRLGLRLGADVRWPMMRSYRPGCPAWFLEGDEARFLSRALEQLIEIAPRARANSTILAPAGPGSLLLRTAREERGAYVWEDETAREPAPVDADESGRASGAAGTVAQRLPRRSAAMELDFSLLPAPVQEPRERPYFAYLLLMVDEEGGILANEAFKPLPSLTAMYAACIDKIVGELTRAGWLPSAFHVHSERVARVLSSFPAVGIPVVLRDRLPHLDPARESLLNYLARK